MGKNVTLNEDERQRSHLVKEINLLERKLLNKSAET